MANEDGYCWGSPCSSDSTNGRDYSPSESVHQAHQYAPVYYPPQYDRPEIVYDDAGSSYYSGGSGGVLMATSSTAPTGGDGQGKMLNSSSASSGPLTLMGGAVQQAGGLDDATSTTLSACGGGAAGAGLTEVSIIGGGPVPFVRVVKRRTTANKKERRRTQSINSAFTFLRDCIPNVPSDTKLSKVRVSREKGGVFQCVIKNYISIASHGADQDASTGHIVHFVFDARVGR